MWVGLQALIAAVVVNVALRALALALLDIPEEFPPLQGPGPTVFFTTVGVAAGVAVFLVVRRVAAQPVRLFQRVAAVALILSFIPDFWLLTDDGGRAFPGATVPGVATLMVQHVAAAVILVWMVTASERKKKTGSA